MYNKLRTIQKMLRIKILELEKLEKKYNKVLKKNQNLLSENENLKKAFDISQEENINLKNKLNDFLKKTKPKAKTRTTGRTKSNASSTKSDPT